MPQLALTLNLDGLDAERVEEACFECGALAVSYTDQRDDPILEPAPGEFRLWPHSRMQALFPFETSILICCPTLKFTMKLSPCMVTDPMKVASGSGLSILNMGPTPVRVNSRGVWSPDRSLSCSR